jgi:hypothetical protein
MPLGDHTAELQIYAQIRACFFPLAFHRGSISYVVPAAYVSVEIELLTRFPQSPSTRGKLQPSNRQIYGSILAAGDNCVEGEL